jgi:hypothetical protein
MSKVLVEIDQERCFFQPGQNEKWKEQNHCPADWLTILMEEVGEASRAALETRFGWRLDGYAAYRRELIQVAAVAVAAVECLDRGKWSR